MSFLEIILVSISLSLDAAVVAMSAGALRTIGRWHALRIAIFFGAFQAVMPLLGWYLGLQFASYLIEYGHIIGFVLLLLVGGKMLWEALKKEEGDEVRDITRITTLTVLAVATSIDALVMGITFSFIPVFIPLAIVTIGLVTFIICMAALYLGKKGSHFFGSKIEIVGAAVLIALAFKVLLF